ncbi:MAG: GNAT family N-acetyltransferase [bacterium]
MKALRIVLAYGEVGQNPSPDQQDTLNQVDSIQSVLRSAGHEVHLLALTLNLGLVDSFLRRINPDLVFNLVESINGLATFVPTVTAFFEDFGLPHTGCSSSALRLSGNKLTSRKVLQNACVPQAPIFGDTPLATKSTPLWIVKSVDEHASFGIDQTSVVESSKVAQKISSMSASLGGNWFAEQYLPGREFNVSILETLEGPKVLPVAEIEFEGFVGNEIRLVDYAAKWNTESEAFLRTPRRFPKKCFNPQLFEQLEELSLRCWNLFSLNGAARVDFRLDEGGQPRVLEVNANPCLSPDAGFSASADQAGISYPELIEQLVEIGLRNSSSFHFPVITQKNAQSPDSKKPQGWTWRKVLNSGDVGKITDLVQECGNFRGDEIEIATELVQEHLNQGVSSGYEFLLLEKADILGAFACWGPIPGSVGSYDLYWLAVAPDFQGAGLGTLLFKESIQQIFSQGGRQIFIETSSRDNYLSAQRFYQRQGAELMARLPDFYQIDDDKLIFCVRQLT